MAASHAAGPGRRVLLLERTRDGGRKILISGGGRCNVLPGSLDETRFVTASSPNTMRKILRSWPLAEQRRFFEERLSLPLVLEEATGKLFPVADRSRVVRDALVDLVRHRKVEWVGDTQVTAMRPGNHRWELITADGRQFVADAVIVATGGLSVPATGSDGFGLQQLAALGHTIRPTYPALTPITLDPPEFAVLAGLSLNVTLTATGANERCEARGGFLFTHRGYSGPSVLDVSHVAVRDRLAGAGERHNSACSGPRWTPRHGKRCWLGAIAQERCPPWCVTIFRLDSPTASWHSQKFQEAPCWRSLHARPGFG